MNSIFHNPKSVVKYIILGVFSLLFFINNIKAQTKAEIEFEQFGKKMIVLKFAKLKLL
jgi:hypothetical protein